jgi:hypothetical protein
MVRMSEVTQYTHQTCRMWASNICQIKGIGGSKTGETDHKHSAAYQREVLRWWCVATVVIRALRKQDPPFLISRL